MMDPLINEHLQILSLHIELLRGFLSIFRNNVADYGVIRALSLESVFLQARGVVQRIRLHVLVRGEARSKEAWLVKQSYTTSFNMIAVAGAIVAQIAITALSLEYLEDTHWTATAAFVISLVAGLLSVYYACILQQQLSGLHGPEEVKRWLTTAHNKSRLQVDAIIEMELSSQYTPGRYMIPSYNAALLLVLPSVLLNWSSIALLVGIGIYYGIVHTENLSSVRGNIPSLAILLVYVLFTLGATASYMLPWFQKRLEYTAPARSARERLFSDEPRSSSHIVSGDDFSHANHTGHSVRLDPLSTGGIRDLGHLAPEQDDPPVASRTVPPRSPRPDDGSGGEFNDSHIGSRPLTCPKVLHRSPLVMPAFVAALDASIAAQKASLRAHKLLRSELREQQEGRPSVRRASL